MGKKKENGLTVTVRNASGTRTRYPDGRVEGDHITVSAERHAIALEGINRLRREVALKKDSEAM